MKNAWNMPEWEGSLTVEQRWEEIKKVVDMWIEHYEDTSWEAAFHRVRGFLMYLEEDRK